VPTDADQEKRLRALAAAHVAVGSEASLEDVLQQTVNVAARLVASRYAALGVLDRTGSHLERSSQRGSMTQRELGSAIFRATTVSSASCFVRRARSPWLT
jgi:hypothetical protein